MHRWQLDSCQPCCSRGREKRGAEEPADHALGRSRGGFGTKLHLVTDGWGIPLAEHVTAGQVHESTQFEVVITAVQAPSNIVQARRKQCVTGDKGYSVPRIREWLRQHSMEAVIPHKDDERKRDPQGTAVFDKQAYRRRCVIERCIGWLKENRAVATRFDKLAVNYLSTVRVAIIRHYLRLLVRASERQECAKATALALAATG